MSEPDKTVSYEPLEKKSTEMDEHLKTNSFQMMISVTGESEETLHTERQLKPTSVEINRTLNQQCVGEDKTLDNKNTEMKQEFIAEEERNGTEENENIISYQKCSKRDLIHSLNLQPRETLQGSNSENEPLEPCAKADPQTVNISSVKKCALSQGCEDEETHKENYERIQKQKMADSSQEHTKKNHRKSASPNHVGDNRRISKVVQWMRHKDLVENSLVPDKTFSEDSEAFDDMEKVASKDEDLLKFAEILYKCSLCTTLPCILTSQNAFLRHVREHHLATQALGYQCLYCSLHFQTNTDLLAHLAEAHSHSEKENCAVDKDSSSPHLEHESPKPVFNNDNKSEKGDEEQSIKMDVESDDENLDQSLLEQKSSKQQKEEEVESSLTPQANGSSRPNSSTPLATLEYHSSTQHHPRPPRSTGGSSVSPPLHHMPPADSSRSPLFSGVPEGLNGFPSFTPEFGRYTKLIREGGRIVYFCQVCNTKCQVKAAFQAHCNGIRHHNTVTMAGKNKSHGTSPLSSRDPGLRTPLKEVPVMGPQLITPRADNSFIEKMTKFFQDHSDVSTVLNPGNPLVMNSFWGSPVNFSLKDRSVDDLDFKETKPCIKDIKIPDKGSSFNKSFCAENRTLSPPYFQRQFGQKTHSDELCAEGAARKADSEKTKVWRVSENPTSDPCDSVCAGSRKRAAPSVSNSHSPSLSEESVPPFRTSSSSSAGSSLCRDRRGTGINVLGHDGTPERLNPKRPKLDTPQTSETQNSSDERSETGVMKESSRTDCDLSTQQSTFSDHHKQPTPTHSAHANRQKESCFDSDDRNTYDDDIALTSEGSPSLLACSLRPDTKHQPASDSSISSGSGSSPAPRHEQSVPGMQFVDAKQQYASDPSNLSQVLSSDIKQQPRNDSSNVPGVLPLDIKQQSRIDSPGGVGPALRPDQHAVLGMLAKHRLAMDSASCLFSSVVSEAWLRQEGVREMEHPAWGSVGLSVHEQDEVTDGGKGQNSEGWKVTQIRDVLKGLIAASTKGSSVSRDVLLHRVSLVLQSPDVQHWGPACNRAVRDLFPHCLAQRKGKFKKTYFFGLALIPGLEESKGGDLVPVDGTSFRPLRDMTQDLEQLLEHLPDLLYWSGEVERGVSRDAVLQVLAARLSEVEVFHWGMQCNKALRMLFPPVLMKRKGKYKTTVYFGVEFTTAAKKLLATIGSSRGQTPWQELGSQIGS